MPIAKREIGSLASINVMMFCPNHHRQLHHGGVEVVIIPTVYFTLSSNKKLLPFTQRNSASTIGNDSNGTSRSWPYFIGATGPSLRSRKKFDISRSSRTGPERPSSSASTSGCDALQIVATIVRYEAMRSIACASIWSKLSPVPSS
jgi:hypothetical protein